jgi:hypothetical protein
MITKAPFTLSARVVTSVLLLIDFEERDEEYIVPSFSYRLHFATLMCSVCKDEDQNMTRKQASACLGGRSNTVDGLADENRPERPIDLLNIAGGLITRRSKKA